MPNKEVPICALDTAPRGPARKAPGLLPTLVQRQGRCSAVHSALRWHCSAVCALAARGRPMTTMHRCVRVARRVSLFNEAGQAGPCLWGTIPRRLAKQRPPVAPRRYHAPHHPHCGSHSPQAKSAESVWTAPHHAVHCNILVLHLPYIIEDI